MASEQARFAAFLVTGGIAAGVNILARIVLERVAGYEAAIGFAYLAGMVTAFILARVFVFKPVQRDTHGQFVRFAMVNALAFAQVWLVSVGLDRLIFPAIGFEWQRETVAHVIGVLSPVAGSYLLHKHFSFRAA
jgi:putative flippase GtrA